MSCCVWQFFVRSKKIGSLKRKKSQTFYFFIESRYKKSRVSIFWIDFSFCYWFVSFFFDSSITNDSCTKCFIAEKNKHGSKKKSNVFFGHPRIQWIIKVLCRLAISVPAMKEIAKYLLSNFYHTQNGGQYNFILFYTIFRRDGTRRSKLKKEHSQFIIFAKFENLSLISTKFSVYSALFLKHKLFLGWETFSPKGMRRKKSSIAKHFVFILLILL